MTTELQKQMLNKIARDEMTTINGAEPLTANETHTWADSIIETPTDKGVFTSLLNAGLVWHSDHDRDAGCGLTEAGFDAYKNIPTAIL